MADSTPAEDSIFKLSNLHLKKIVKENHGHTVKELKFCEIHPNLLASVGGPQATIYDNENAGEHLDIMMNFVNMDTPALLKVLAATQSTRRTPSIPGLNHATPGLSMHQPPLNSQDPSSYGKIAPSMHGGIVVSEDSRSQLLAMRAIVDDGGFDEDIYIGVKDLGVFPPKPSSTKPTDAGADTSGPPREAPQAASDILQNKRLMQGAGRDIELFDRDDRKLRTCAWVAFPPKTFLSPTELASLRQALELRTRGLGFPDQELFVNGACDVDVTRVDRTDAWLAVAGADGLVQLLSVAFAKALYALPGHNEPIVALSSGRMSTCLASLSKNWIIVWNIALIARHHYNAYHNGGPGLEYICDDEDVFTPDFSQLGDRDPTDEAHNSWPDHLRRLPMQYRRWILQVIPTPSPHLTSLEFTRFGLVAGASSGHLYNWPFVPHDQTFSHPSLAPNDSKALLTDNTDTLGPRIQSGKRLAPGAFPRPEYPTFWSPLPKRIINHSPSVLNWPSLGEGITALVRKPGTVESPIPAIAIRTNTRVVVVALPQEPAVSMGQQPPQSEVLSEVLLPGSPPPNSAASSASGPTTRQSSWEAMLDPRSKPARQSLDLSSCGRFAMIGQDSGDVYLLGLLNSSIIAKLEHKRSKFRIKSCVMSHHLKDVLFASDGIIWRWDFLSPSFLQKERAEQAQAEAEGVDIGSDSDVEEGAE